MAPIGKLYGFKGNNRLRRALAAAALADVEIEYDSSFSMAGGAYKTPEFLEKFPYGYLPAFETSDGLYLQESEAIAEYIASSGPNSTLLPSDKAALAKVRQYSAFADQEVFIPHGVLNGMIAGYVPYNKPVFTTLIEKVMRRLEVLNQELLSKTYLVGERITLADIYLATALVNAFTGQLDASYRSKIPNVVRYVETIIKSPKLASIFGDEFVEKAAAYTPPKKEETKPKAEAPKEPKAPKAPKPKAAKEEDDDDEEPLVPEEPKVKNPLDDLPKSAFNLEEWKRQYSNLDTRKEALPWFYEKFDHEGFSIWRVDFKYNEELTQVFMSSNQIGGFFNRLEASRKYLFGSMGVLGKANDSIISGAIICRGKAFEPVINVAPDWESYTYAPIDVSKPEDKEFFEGAMAWDLIVDGKEWADGKNFK